jgi:MFS family permease
MAGLHGAWSVGLLLSGALGTALAAAGVSFRTHFIAVAVALAVLAPLLQRGLLPEQAAPQARRERGRGRLLGALHSAAVLVLGGVALASFCSEGAASDWSAVYLHERLDASQGLAGAAFVAFASGIAGARLVADAIVRRLGAVVVVRTGASLAAASLAVGLAVPVRAVALVGFVLFGVGLAPVVPAVFSAAGGLDARGVVGALGWVVTISYFGSIAGPAVIGFLAQHAGLRVALFVPVGLAVWIALAAGSVRGAIGGEAPAAPIDRGF